MKVEIERLERIISKLKRYKIEPNYVENLEWQLRALKAESQLEKVEEVVANLKKGHKYWKSFEGEKQKGIAYGFEKCIEDIEKTLTSKR